MTDLQNAPSPSGGGSALPLWPLPPSWVVAREEPAPAPSLHRPLPQKHWPSSRATEDHVCLCRPWGDGGSRLRDNARPSRRNLATRS